MKSGTDPHAQKKLQQHQVHSTTQTPVTSAVARPVQSLAQKRAGYALDRINEIEGKDYTWESNYLSYVKALPATIIMSGLGQALAMVKAGANKKGDVKKGNAKLYEHMSAWLCNEDGSGWQNSPYRREDNVLDAITNLDEDDYIRAQAEAMEYLEWLKKFAVAFLVEKEGGGGE